jgi:hypothetical protein
MPALPLGDAGPYVAAAYLVFLALILVYVGIMASKLVRIERQAAELNELAARRDADRGAAAREPGAGETRPNGPVATRPAEPAERP